MKKSIYILASILALLFLYGANSVNAQEVEDEREFDYTKGSEKGPKKWGELKKEWAACKDGKFQSPIDMSNGRVRVISKPEKRNYKPFNATVRNRGHDISLRWHGDAGSILINGTDYPLQQLHWHSPSEHTINGRRYDMELHLVHQTSDLNVKNRIAVTGVFYKIGKPDKFLSKGLVVSYGIVPRCSWHEYDPSAIITYSIFLIILVSESMSRREHLNSIQLMTNITSIVDQKDEDRNLGIINPKDIKMNSQRYYRYVGSLTTPPCTEGVIWTLNTKVKTVSRDQVKLLREAVHDYAEENARPLQPHNSREIYLYGPGDTSD